MGEKWERRENGTKEAERSISCPTCPGHHPGTEDHPKGIIHLISLLAMLLPEFNTPIMTHRAFLYLPLQSHSLSPLSLSCKLPRHQNTEPPMPGIRWPPEGVLLAFDEFFF